MTSGELKEELTPEEQKYIEERAIRFEIANKLVCPITKQEIFDKEPMKFGFPMAINLDKFDRVQVQPVIEVISDRGVDFITNGLKYGKSIYGCEFNKWLPLYINDHHFSLVKDDLFSFITDVLRVKTFKPLDVLKVFPSILVKTAILFLKGELHQSYAAIDAYCQIQYLFVKLI
jgi:hypothetical protein